MDKIYQLYDNVILLGDLNLDLTDQTKGIPLRDVCDVFDLQNLVKTPTCYMKDSNPSLVDVILTNRPTYYMKTNQCDTGLSDWHNMTYSVLRGNCIPFKRTKMNYRSFKELEQDAFIRDLERIPFHVPHIFEDIDDVY